MNSYDQHFKKMKKKSIQKEQVLRKALKPKASRKKAPFPISVVIYSLVICVLMTLGLANLDYLETLPDKISISLFSSSQAQEPSKEEKSTETKGESEEQNSPELRSEMANRKSASVVKDINYFKMLESKESMLDQKEKRLKKLEENLQLQQEELIVKLRSLEQMRAEISFALKDKVETDDKTVDKLVQIYSNMKPKQAATVIETMKEELSVKILKKMKKKNAAAILNVVKAQRAKYLTEKIAGYEN